MDVHYVAKGRQGKKSAGLCHVKSHEVAFLDIKSVPNYVRLLDCSKESSNEATDTRPLITNQENINDMCCIVHEGKCLLITSDSDTPSRRAVHAYNMDTGVQEWQLSGKLGNLKHAINPCSVCCDHKGNLYILDGSNKCVLIVNAKGKYIKSILYECEAILTASWLRWFQGENGLVVSHHKGGKHFITLFG